MNLTGFWEFIGRASEWFFLHVMESLRNMPNLFFITFGTLVFLIWMWQMAKYNKEAADNGTYK